MALKDELIALVDELNRAHSGALSWADEFGLPDFVTTTNGMQCHFTRIARKTLTRLSELMHSNRLGNLPKIELKEYEKVARRVIADMYTEGKFEDLSKTGDKTAIKIMRTSIEEQIANITHEYTHYFPAWTVGLEHGVTHNS